jgi:argininosuccinate lyase
MLDLRKFSWDMSLFLTQEYNLLNIDSKYSTGSSIMPNKSNPDVIEIIRANYSIVAGHYQELENLSSLPSGYHRDLQLTKRSIIHSIHCVIKTLKIIPELVQSIRVNAKRSHDFVDEDMLMTSKVYALVQAGMPFREAYLKIKTGKDTNVHLSKSQKNKFSSGSPFNLQLPVLRRRLKKYVD